MIAGTLSEASSTERITVLFDGSAATSLPDNAWL